jgi:hypothetical protein
MGTGATGGYIFAFDYPTFLPKNLWLQSPGGSVTIGHSDDFTLAKLDVRTNIGSAISGLGLSTGVSGITFGPDVNRAAVRGAVNTDFNGGYAGVFVGDTEVIGTLTKSAGSFMIDHPLEPESKYLLHSFVESPDMKNIYDGVVSTDLRGYAVVHLPGWFEALNMEFRYQLTCIGQFAQAIVLEEIQGNHFVIQTDKPGVKVSWQVTGVRHDPYAVENRIPVEKLKSNQDQGRYIYPQGYNKPKEMSLKILTPSPHDPSPLRIGD